ncbi:MAG TPA: hypothetical protein VLV50_15285 [Stellaceae bacterium]|nr:hypothetical protein [Stellaceae bacterium]
MVFLTGYFAVGLVLGWAWNRVEFTRSGLRGTAGSCAAFLFVWPLFALYAAAATIMWRRFFGISNGTGASGPLAAPSVPKSAAIPPDPPALTGRAAAH